MDEKLCFVQFIHPGGEHKPDGDGFKGWNKRHHRRKFLKSHGRYMDGSKKVNAAIVFWGEWEPHSKVKKFDRPFARGPKFLHEPYYKLPNDSSDCQNTDPFVFGNSFHYTFCQQHTKHRPTQLSYLAPGSLILFGSCKDKKFVLDTVFVVSHYIDHTKSNWKSQLNGRISATYRDVTIKPWYSSGKPERQSQSHRLYFGATPPQHPFKRMFSFFPCQPYGKSQNGFARPIVEIPDYITPKLTQGRKITKDISVKELRNNWDKIVRQVTDQGLMLGVYARVPSSR